MPFVVVSVDEEDADLLSYILNVRIRVGQQHTTLHQAIADRMGMQREMVDHVNRNPLDNRRFNLRPATRTQNAANISRRSDNTSGYIGVGYVKNKNKYRARVDGRHLGLFDTAEAAAIERDRVAYELYGEFANLNFPIDKYEKK